MAGLDSSASIPHAGEEANRAQNVTLSQGMVQNNIPHDAAPTGPEALAPQPATVSEATAPALTGQDSDVAANGASSPVVSVKQETETKKSTKKKTTSKAKQAAVKSTVYNSQLLVTS